MKTSWQLVFKVMAIMSLSLVLCACGGGDDAPPVVVNGPVLTTTYKVEYTEVTPPQEGKSEVKIRVTDKLNGTVVTNIPVALTPNMAMTPTVTNPAGYSHGTPFSAVTNNNDGTYSATIYYSMASKNADGSSLGDWDLTFSVNGENAKFYPVVARNAVTARRALKGISDTILAMTGTPTGRNYLLFSEGISASTGAVNLYIAAVDNQMMTQFPAIYTDATLHDSTGVSWVANPVKVEFSNDKINWIEAGPGTKQGQWVANVPGMTANGSVYARLTVNAEQKTTDGLAVGATNGYQTFTVTP